MILFTTSCEHSSENGENVPLGVSVEVEPVDGGLGLLETDVVEPGEGRAVDVLDLVVGHEEVLLPPHEDKVRLLQGLVVKVVGVEVLRVRHERVELALQTRKNLIEAQIRTNEP